VPGDRQVEQFKLSGYTATRARLGSASPCDTDLKGSIPCRDVARLAAAGQAPLIDSPVDELTTSNRLLPGQGAANIGS
jgi:hypothetical protein